ncbi:MAG: TRAP transporter fused permease subunit, partial [Alphaproteobacteria bacterium]|nr:TRAP transporter fused permease subunit [Alphaproteobacteria bacterium]
MTIENPDVRPQPMRPAFLQPVIDALAFALVALAIAYAVDAFRIIGIVMAGEQFAAAMLGIAFLLLFLTIPARGRAVGVPPWYDIVLGLIGAAASFYIGYYFADLSVLVVLAPADGLVAALAVIILSLEGVRRTIGWPLVIVAFVFLAYGALGQFIPGALAARPTPPLQLAYYLAFDTNAMLGAPILVACTIVIAFVIFGNLLTATGGSGFFTDVALTLMGRYRGGSAKIAIVGSSLFGTISGSAVGNVVATGVVTIPLMKKGGYASHQAGAIEAVASTGGSLMPPVMGAAAFVMAEFLQVSYGQVMVAAAIPAILYYAVLFIIADLEAARAGISRVDEELIPRGLQVLKEGWFFIIPFVVLIGGLFWMNLRADEAALWASLALVIAAFAFGYKGERPTIRTLFDALTSAGHGVLDIIMICCAAGVVIGVLAITGLGFGLTLMLVSIAGKNLFILMVLTAIVSIILGMGMPTIAVYVLLAALVAPAMMELGVQPMAAHLFVLYFGMMSFITPPVAVAAFAAATIAKADPFRTGFTSMRFGWIAYIIPFLFCFSP